jgi:transcriptional regulator with XRE-family HTH domain
MSSIQRQIGSRLKKLRRSRGLTLDQLAKATGFTKSYLSRIENCKKVPPIGSLAQICQALNVELAAVFQNTADKQDPAENVFVVRAKERQSAVRGGTTFGYDYEALAHSAPHKHMEPFLFTFPRAIGEEIYFQHVGQEFIFVLSGKLRFLVESREWILGPGDSVFFDSSLPHRGEAIGGVAKALVVIYSPDFVAEEKETLGREYSLDRKPHSRHGRLHTITEPIRTRLSYPDK